MAAMANQARAYGATTRWLHWLTALALLGQFVVGYLLDVDDSGRGRGRGRGRGGGSGRGRGRGGEDDDFPIDLGWNLLTAHVSLGTLIVLLAALRLVWRRVSGLPPWAETLSERQRRFATLTERTLLTLLFVVPITGIVLVLGGDDDLLPLHVVAHIAFYVALTAHVGLVLWRGLLPRML
jgi:cytochrome b561